MIEGDRVESRINHGYSVVYHEIIDIFGPKMGGDCILLYLALLRYAGNDTRACWPSIAKLAQSSTLSESSVRRRLKDLEEYGLISITPRQATSASASKSNLYTLLSVGSALQVSARKGLIDAGNYEIYSHLGKTTIHIHGRNSGEKVDTSLGCQADRVGYQPDRGEGVTLTGEGVTLIPELDEYNYTQLELENMRSFRASAGAGEKQASEQKTDKIAEQFAQIWEHFAAVGRTDDRGRAQEEYKRKNPKADGELFAQIIAALVAQRAYREEMTAAGHFVPEWPYAATWLRNRRWFDEIKPVPAKKIPKNFDKTAEKSDKGAYNNLSLQDKAKQRLQRYESEGEK